MSQSSSGSASSKAGSATAAKKTRSPVEKVIVWGGIVVLLALVSYQARARFGYNMTLNALQSRLEEDEGTDAKPLLVADLDQYLVGWPSKKDEKKSQHLGVIELSWPGLTESFGLLVDYDPEEGGGTVMSVQSKNYVEPEPPPLVAPKPGEDRSSLPPGAPGGPPLPADAGAKGKADAPAAAEPATEEPAAAAPANEAPAEEPAAADPANKTPAEEPAAESAAANE